MRHRKKSERFSRPRAQKKALVKSLVRAMVINERITTITSRAKYLKGEIDRLITRAKKGTLAGKRLAYRILEDHKLVKKLFDDIGPRFKDVNGGYTRSLRLGNRKGDGASLSIIELTKRVKKKKIHKKKEGKAEVKEASKEEKSEKVPPKKITKPKKSFVTGVKKIFKKERDAL
ncbi:MAG: 50S ribosomal protein L17 [Candidatus Omnitrophica bacterium]|nr:50S ribosomal protein L17 [Candidatus Omnitrophota bacterium]